MNCDEAIERSDVDCIVFNDLMYENFGDFFIFNENFINKENEMLNLYYKTLNNFADADLCCQSYNLLKYHDTSTDLRSTVNHPQFGSQLYPALYPATIACRGYLNSHKKPCKLVIPGKRGSFKQLRGSQNKLMNNLKNELNETIDNILNMECNKIKDNNNNNKNSIHLELRKIKISNNTSLYIDVLPFITYFKQQTIINEYNLNLNALSMISTINRYSNKFNDRLLPQYRFENVIQSIKVFNESKNEEDINMIDELLDDDIEEC